jgi:hypothetical protein
MLVSSRSGRKASLNHRVRCILTTQRGLKGKLCLSTRPHYPEDVQWKPMQIIIPPKRNKENRKREEKFDRK